MGLQDIILQFEGQIEGFEWLTAGLNFSVQTPNSNLAEKAAATAGAPTACCCWRAADAVGGYADADAATGKLAQAWKSCQKWSYMKEREPQKVEYAPKRLNVHPGMCCCCSGAGGWRGMGACLLHGATLTISIQPSAIHKLSLPY
eukprot:1140096-Pelagomonas_calceolata.AAC.1